MADFFTSALRQAAAWVPGGDDSHDAIVGREIESWHAVHPFALPDDVEFQRATWEVPADGPPTGDAKLRVTLPCGNVYVLDIDRDGVCGCSQCCGRPSYTVREAHIGLEVWRG